MEVKIARTAGFCWGVRRTVDRVMELAGRATGRWSPWARSSTTRRRSSACAAMGVGTVGAVAEVPEGTTVVVRTHGAVKSELEAAKARGLELVDGTCPYVKYPQAMAQRLSRKGYHVVVVGDADHAEVKGVVSLRRGPLHGGAAGRPGACRLGQEGGGDRPDHLHRRRLRRAGGRAGPAPQGGAGGEHHLLRHRRAAGRRPAPGRLGRRGGGGGRPNSANTRHLAEICREIQPRTWHVETEAGALPGLVRRLPQRGPQRRRLHPGLGGRGGGRAPAGPASGQAAGRARAP